MGAQMATKSGFEKWQDGINAARGNKKWDMWDCEIRQAVNEYNRHLAGTAGYRPLNWLYIKAMIWVETGATSSEWEHKSMQIGVVGDPGLEELLSGHGGELILPPGWKSKLSFSAVRSLPAYNIRAGIGYLLLRSANFQNKNVVELNSEIERVTVKNGDSFDKIARTHNTTIETLKQLNPHANILHAGEVLKYQRSRIKRVIVGWKGLTIENIAERYNTNRDSRYANKLTYALSAIQQRGTSACAK